MPVLLAEPKITNRLINLQVSVIARQVYRALFFRHSFSTENAPCRTSMPALHPHRSILGMERKMGGRITRRAALVGSILTLPVLSLPPGAAHAAPERMEFDTIFRNLEKNPGARLGVAAQDTGSDSRIE